MTAPPPPRQHPPTEMKDMRRTLRCLLALLTLAALTPPALRGAAPARGQDESAAALYKAVEDYPREQFAEMRAKGKSPGRNTAAFFAQAGISFAIALLAMLFAVLYLPVDPWVRAFLGLGTLYLTTSAFTLAKCIRDAQDTQSVVTRLDQARVDKILAEHDPFRSVS